MKARLIINPDSRKAVSGRRLRMIERKLADGGIECDVHRAALRGETRLLASEAKSAGYHMVVCGGGDGTIHEVVNGLAGTDIVLGILPMGTGNVLAWELGIPLDPIDACEVLMHGKTRAIDLVRTSEGRYFSCMAGVGLDAQAIKELNLRMKEAIGCFAYPLNGIQTLMRYDLPEISVEMDGVSSTITGHTVVICNSRRYGGRFMLCPRARIDDGLLDVCVLRTRARYSLLRSALAVLTNLHGAMQGITFHRTRAVRVRSPHPVLVQVDGDVAGTTPVDFSVVPGYLKVMTPCPRETV